MLKKNLLFIPFLVAFAGLAWGHDVWLTGAGGHSYRLVFGHPGDLEPYDPTRVIAVAAVDQKGATRKLNGHIHDGHLMVEAPHGTSVIAVTFDNGIWTEGPDEQELNKPKREVPGYLSSSHLKNFSKMILAWSEAARKPMGADFEIVPLVDPLSLKPGQELTVQLLYKGKPLAGAEIEILGAMDLFFTDDEGKADLPISNDGFQYILAQHREKLKDNPDTDELSWSANLTFSL